MKNIICFFVLICSVAMIIVSCAKKDDDSTTAATSVTTTTPSGSITLGSYSVSGVYKSSCISSGVSALAALGLFPSDVNSYGFVFVVKGNDSFSQETHTFTDTECTTSSYINKLQNDNVTVGKASGSNYSVTYNYNAAAVTANTTTAETYVETLWSKLGASVDLTVGTEKIISADGSLKYGLWTPIATTIYIANESSSSTPSSAGSLVYTKE